MKNTVMVGGLLGIVFSLAAMLFAVVDDSYTFGNFGLLAMLGSIIGVVGSFYLLKNNSMAITSIVFGCVLGVYGLSYLYIIPLVLMLFPCIYIGFKHS